MTDLVTRFRDKISLLGLQRTILLTPGWLLRPEYLVLYRDIGTAFPPVPEVNGLSWSWLKDGDLERLTEVDTSLSLQSLRTRLDDGQECLLGYFGPILVHFRWHITKDNRLPYLGKEFCLQPGDMIDDLAFTHPNYRCLGINTASFVKGLQLARDKGFQRALTLVAVWNRHVWRISLGRLGFKLAGTVGYWNLATFKLHFAKGDLRLNTERGIYLPLD